MDDVTWAVEGTGLDEVVGKLEKCAAASLHWAERNAVKFETSKTEAILFSRQQRHQQCIRVRDQTVHFAHEATRWLEIWPDSSLIFAENRRRRIGRLVRQMPGSGALLLLTYGVPPAAICNLRMALV